MLRASDIIAEVQQDASAAVAAMESVSSGSSSVSLVAQCNVAASEQVVAATEKASVSTPVGGRTLDRRRRDCVLLGRPAAALQV